MGTKGPAGSVGPATKINRVAATANVSYPLPLVLRLRVLHLYFSVAIPFVITVF